MPDWQIWSFKKDAEERRINVSPRLIFNDMISLRASAIAGAGIAYLPRHVLASAFEAGEFVKLLPGWEGQISMISVLTPPKSQLSRLAAAFSAFLATELPGRVR